ncbi:MAG: tetratricopeptide repeat protein [Cyanobacteria bacterium SZAS-4]|nr:tetratricopeptide repeat protein [Cyanobacteria bacterium SZAS-4]
MNTKDNDKNGSKGNTGIKNNGSVKSPRFTVRHRAGKAPLMMHDLSECTGEGDCIHEQGIHQVEDHASAKPTGNKTKRVVPVKSIRATAKPHKKLLTAKKAVIGESNPESASEIEIDTEVDKSTTTQVEPKPSANVSQLKLVKNIVENNRKLFTGGFIATLVVGIIAGSTFGIGKMLPANTDVVQFVTGMVTDAHADQLSQQGKVSDAILEYEKAIQQSPNDLTAYKKLATIYELETREWTKAIKVLKDALIINDSDSDVHRLLAYAQFWNGETMDAAKSAQKAIDLRRGDSVATSTMALIVAAGGDLSKGKDLIQQAMNTDPNNSAVISNAALFYRLYAKDDSKAEELIRKAIKMSPTDVNNWWELSNILRNENKKDDAEQALRKAHTMQPDSGYRSADLASYLASTSVKKYDEAADLYRQAIAQGFDDANTVDSLGAALFNGGKYSEAAIEYQKAVDLQPDNTDHVLMLGRSQYQAKNYTAAKDAFTKLVNMDGKYTSYNWLGVTNFAAGDYNAAVSNFNAALRIKNNDATLWANLANATDKLGDTFDAADYAFNGLDLDANNDTVWSAIDQIGNHMIKNNQRDLARELFSEAAGYQSTSAGRSQVVSDLNRLS